MSSFAYHILRLALAITFIWVGIMILRDPVAWGAFIDPWARDLIPFGVEGTIMFAGVLDIVLGGLLLFGWFVSFASAVAAIHIAAILVASGVDAITVRDIGLLGASIALSIEALRRK